MVQNRVPNRLVFSNAMIFKSLRGWGLGGTKKSIPQKTVAEMPVGPWEHGGVINGAVQRVQKDNGLMTDLMTEFVGSMVVLLQFSSLDWPFIDCHTKTVF